MFNHPLYLHVNPDNQGIQEFGKEQIEEMANQLGLSFHKSLYMHNLSRLETAVFMLVVNNDIDELESHYREPNFNQFKIVGRNGQGESLWYKQTEKYALYLEISFRDLKIWYNNKENL